MKRCALLALLAASGLFAQASRQITVKQLEQVLTWQRATHVDDSRAARQIESLELSEQLTGLALDRIETEFHPGKEASMALDLLSDLSAFLSTPAAELPERNTPTRVEQQKIVQAAESFSKATLHHLPDFLATRVTRRFEDVPVIMPRHSYQSGLHLSGTLVRETAYRDGHEVDPETPVPSATLGSNRTAAASLSSIGEFGQVLAIIMSDSENGNLSWRHWQQTPAGMVAVFDYRVPKNASHYRVHFCCEWSRVNHTDSYEGTPAYHGTLSIDPLSGAVLGLTLVVDFQGFDPPPLYDLEVSYAKIQIGGRSAVLPIRSAVIGEEITPGKKRNFINLYVNDITFTNYRRFGSTVKVLPSTENQ